MIRNEKKNKEIENRRQRDREQEPKRLNRKKEEHPLGHSSLNYIIQCIQQISDDVEGEHHLPLDCE